MASWASLSQSPMLKTLLARPGAMGVCRLRISAKRLTVRCSLIGTVLTKVLNDRPLPGRGGTLGVSSVRLQGRRVYHELGR